MAAIFDKVDESQGEPFRPQPLALAFARNPSLPRRLAEVAAVIRTHFIAPSGWRFRLHGGSLTFQNRRDVHAVVKIFVDLGNELARRCGIAIPPDPIVVGVELTCENPFARACIRDALGAAHGDYYIDPRAPRVDSLGIVFNRKYWVCPHGDHLYDVIFLRPGPCDYPVDPGTFQRFAKRIEGGIEACDVAGEQIG